MKREASLQRLLCKLKQENFFNENEYDKLYPSGSSPARIYGTLKMQKFSPSDSFPKLLPIVSSIGTFNYNLARFLCDLLSSFVSDDYSCKDTFSFVSQIKNANLSKKFLVSYDVTSLFTNIPLQETIDIAINLIFNHNPNLNITKKELKNLSVFATSQTHFIFSVKFHNQIDGVAMALAPALANIFMSFYESKWLNEYNLNKPKFYLRYVDDILAAFDKEQDSLSFLNFLNKRHANIKFTIEKQINHSIAFLDVFISGINNQSLTLQTYHKSTYTGLLLNLKSFTSFSCKISLAKCLIDFDRSFKICNNWNSFHNDIENIK